MDKKHLELKLCLERIKVLLQTVEVYETSELAPNKRELEKQLQLYGDVHSTLSYSMELCDSLVSPIRQKIINISKKTTHE